MRIITIVCILLCGGISHHSFAQSPTAILHNNFKAYHNHTWIDVAQIQMNLNSILDNGSWSDIDYSDTKRSNWAPIQHLTRLRDLCIYFQRSNTFTEEEQAILSARIIAAADFWAASECKSSNWWYGQIGVPKEIGTILMLCGELLTEETQKRLLTWMEKSKIGMDGQNRLWLSGNVFVRELIRGNDSLCQVAQQEMEKLVVYAKANEQGIQVDYSFHQHGPQFQQGNYGIHFCEDIVTWMYTFRDSKFAFSEQKIELITNYLLKGQSWMGYKGRYEIMASGRQLFPDLVEGLPYWRSSPMKARLLTNLLLCMKELSPKYTEELDVCLNGKGPVGFCFFPRSDYMVYRSSNFMMGMRMCSSRIIGAEAGNGENKKGYHLGDGAMCIYRTGREYQDIYPVWNWEQLPGTTLAQTAKKLPELSWNGYRISSSFVGGVSAKRNGLAVMAYDRGDTKALKSTVVIDDVIVCLGSGISSSTDNPVTTSINQCTAKGKVYQGNLKAFRKSQLKELACKEQYYSWVWHDSIAYVSLEKKNFSVRQGEQKGKWNEVISWMPDTLVTKDVFSLSIEHGTKPTNASYAYVIYPNVEKEVVNLPQYNEFPQVLALNENGHAVYFSKSKRSAATFWQPTTLQIAPKTTLTASVACTVIVENNNEEYTLFVSDPSQSQESVVLDLQIGKEKRMATVKFPTGIQAGSTTILVVK